MGAAAAAVSERAVSAATRRLVRRLRAEYHVDRVLLFGSRARGDALATSDVDLLVVSPDFAGMAWRERILAVCRLWTGPVALEPFCYTPGEFQRRSGQLTLVREAARTGVRLA